MLEKEQTCKFIEVDQIKDEEEESVLQASRGFSNSGRGKADSVVIHVIWQRGEYGQRRQLASQNLTEV